MTLKMRVKESKKISIHNDKANKRERAVNLIHGRQKKEMGGKRGSGHSLSAYIRKSEA